MRSTGNESNYYAGNNPDSNSSQTGYDTNGREQLNCLNAEEDEYG